MVKKYEKKLKKIKNFLLKPIKELTLKKLIDKEKRKNRINKDYYINESIMIPSISSSFMLILFCFLIR
jgi:hypothetical protein